MKTQTAPEGHKLCSFHDLYGDPCSVKESQFFAKEYGRTIWVGRLGNRMCLSPEMAGELAVTLQHFAEHKELP